MAFFQVPCVEWLEIFKLGVINYLRFKYWMIEARVLGKPEMVFVDTKM